MSSHRLFTRTVFASSPQLQKQESCIVLCLVYCALIMLLLLTEPLGAGQQRTKHLKHVSFCSFLVCVLLQVRIKAKPLIKAIRFPVNPAGADNGEAAWKPDDPQREAASNASGGSGPSPQSLGVMPAAAAAAMELGHYPPFTPGAPVLTYSLLPPAPHQHQRGIPVSYSVLRGGGGGLPGAGLVAGVTASQQHPHPVGPLSVNTERSPYALCGSGLGSGSGPNSGSGCGSGSGSGASDSPTPAVALGLANAQTTTGNGALGCGGLNEIAENALSDTASDASHPVAGTAADNDLLDHNTNVLKVIDFISHTL